MVTQKDFFTQQLRVGLIADHSWAYCKKISEGKKVLHIGCSDWPIFTPDGNMHIYLKPFCRELAGCDINGLPDMNSHCPGRYMSSLDFAEHEVWDTILVPNIIEHLPNPGAMVGDLMSTRFKTLFVLVPNYKVQEQATYADGIFTEKIHPDHYAWYSPYTLFNLFKSHIKTSDTVSMNFFDNQNMISLLIERTQT